MWWKRDLRAPCRDFQRVRTNTDKLTKGVCSCRITVDEACSWEARMTRETSVAEKSKEEEDREEILYVLGAYAMGIEPRDICASARLETLANAVGLFIDRGYIEDVGETVNDICEKANECGLGKTAWLEKLKKKAGIPTGDPDVQERDDGGEYGDEDDDVDETEDK